LAEKRSQRPIPIEFYMPKEIGLGTYANFMRSQANEHEFVLTFCVLKPDQPERQTISPGEETPPVKAVATAVAQIMVPHQLLKRIIEALTTTLAQYEEARKLQSIQASLETTKESKAE
jgi:hypothetical protein